jgi:hypothetical protein
MSYIVILMSFTAIFPSIGYGLTFMIKLRNQFVSRFEKYNLSCIYTRTYDSSDKLFVLTDNLGPILHYKTIASLHNYIQIKSVNPGGCIAPHLY